MPYFFIYPLPTDSAEEAIIKLFIEREQVPTQSDKDKINIGLMAVKELESTDPDYCYLLCEVDYSFRKKATP